MFRITMAGVCIGLLTGALTACPASGQTTIHVNGACGNDAWSGLSEVCAAPDGPKKTIRAAIDSAPDRAVVLVAPGTYTGPGNHSLDLNPNAIVTLRSTDGPEATVFDGGDQAIKAFDMQFEEQGDVVEGFTFTRFRNTAVVMFHSSPAFINCRFVDNSSGGYGGAMFNAEGGIVAAIGCLFHDNTAWYGGAMAGGTGTLLAVNCTFVDNLASSKGHAIDGASLIWNCIFRGEVNQLQLAQDIWYSNIQGGPIPPGRGNFDADPLFVDPANGDFRLLPASPCIDAADGYSFPIDVPIDLAGQPRRMDTPYVQDAGYGPSPIIDIGAFEHAGPACRADCNGDSALDLFDYLCFVNAFSTAASAEPMHLFEPVGRLRSVVTNLTPRSPVAWDPDGSGPASPLIVCASRGVEAWDGSTWNQLAADVNIHEITTFDFSGQPGAPEELVVAGWFISIGGQSIDSIARFAGSGWSQVGNGKLRAIDALAVFDEDDSGPEPARLFAAGEYPFASTARLWRLEGENWTPLSGGPTLTSAVHELGTFDPDGAGPKEPLLVVAGKALLTQADGIVFWDGQTWIVPGGGIDGELFALASSDESGPDGEPSLYVSGDFQQAGGKPASNIARWNGSEWLPLGQGLSSPASSLVIYDGPAAPPSLAAASAEHLVWFGSGWSQLAPAPIAKWYISPGYGSFLAHDPDGSGPAHDDLYLFGPSAAPFLTYGAGRLTEFSPPDVYADCNRDGVLDLFDFLCYTNLFNGGCP